MNTFIPSTKHPGRTSTLALAAVALLGLAPMCSQAQTTRPLPSGLVAWWQAESNTDEYINGNNGLDISMDADGNPVPITYTNGEAGQGFYFDGSTSSLKIAANPTLDVGRADGFTIELWAKPANSNNLMYLAEWNNGQGDNSTADGCGVHFTLYDKGQLYANVVDTDQGQHRVGSAEGVITGDEMQHLALTYSKTSGKLLLYRNGIMVGSNYCGTITPWTSSDLYLGMRLVGVAAPSYFQGVMDEIGLFNRALSAEELDSIYEAGPAGKNEPLVAMRAAAWWKAENDTVDFVNGNNGTGTSLTYTTGEVGRGFSFNGYGTSIQVPANPTLDVGQKDGFTIELWANPASSNSLMYLTEWNSGAGNYGNTLGCGVHFTLYDRGQFYANVVDTNLTQHSLMSPAGLIKANQMQHLALTYSKTNGMVALYYNGAMVASTNYGTFTPWTSSNFYMGKRLVGVAAPSYFQGVMDEVSVYGRALSDKEIRFIYEAGAYGKQNPK